ncbi:MAG: hypothetical protein ABIP29_10120, partial [Candidatus Eisenbacteria bacterium]
TGAEPPEAILAMKEELRALPRHGVGYGLLRHLADAPTRARLAAEPPDVSFNYLGSLDGLLDGSRLFTGAREAGGGAHAPAGQRSYALEVTAYFEGGVLVTAWSFGGDVLARGAVEPAAARFLAALERLVAHCAAVEAETYTPADFPRARLERGELERLVSGIRQAEAAADGED